MSNQKDKKKDIVACLDCRRNHRKCDGKRPCYHCYRNKTECMENPKRKAVGRPRNDDEQIKEPIKKIRTNKIKKTIINKSNCSNCNSIVPSGSVFCNDCGSEQKNKLNKANKKADLYKEKKCSHCDKKQSNATNLYCNDCGNSFEEGTDPNLIQEFEALKQKNELLSNIIQMSIKSPMWVMSRLIMNGLQIQYPVPSYIVESSQSFQDLLGYPDLINMYYPHLVSMKHHKFLDFKNFPMKIKIVPGLNSPKQCFNDYNYVRHADGHYIYIQTANTLYFDAISGMPSYRISYITQVVDMKLEEKDLPPHSFEGIKFTYYCNENDKVPDFTKRFNQHVKKYLNIDDQLQSQNSLSIIKSSDFDQQNFFQNNNNDFVTNNFVDGCIFDDCNEFENIFNNF